MKSVGTCELMKFYVDRKRFPDLDVHGVAVIMALLMFVNTSGRGSKYQANPSRETLARSARVTEPTVRKWTKYFAESGWLTVKRRRAGNRNAPNVYDVTPAVNGIVNQRPALTVLDGGRHEQ